MPPQLIGASNRPPPRLGFRNRVLPEATSEPRLLQQLGLTAQNNSSAAESPISRPHEIGTYGLGSHPWFRLTLRSRVLSRPLVGWHQSPYLRPHPISTSRVGKGAAGPPSSAVRSRCRDGASCPLSGSPLGRSLRAVRESWADRDRSHGIGCAFPGDRWHQRFATARGRRR
jgi:hypothetical protein